MKRKGLFAGMLVLVLLIGTLTVGCTINGDDVSSVKYKNSKEYKLGGATINTDIEEIEIQWVNGDINIEYANVDGIEFSEIMAKDYNEEYKLRYLVSGNKLMIRFCKSGITVKGQIKKNLTVKIPKNYEFKTTTIETVSGKVVLPDSFKSEIISYDGVSADFTNEGQILYTKMDVNTVSGEVIIEADAKEETEINTVSGDVTLSGRLSGTIDADSVSGDVIVVVTSATKFKADYDSVSGRYRTSLEESDNPTLKINVSSVSGDLMVTTDKPE